MQTISSLVSQSCRTLKRDGDEARNVSSYILIHSPIMTLAVLFLGLDYNPYVRHKVTLYLAAVMLPEILPAGLIKRRHRRPKDPVRDST